MTCGIAMVLQLLKKQKGKPTERITLYGLQDSATLFFFKEMNQMIRNSLAFLRKKIRFSCTNFIPQRQIRKTKWHLTRA
uniref:Uncharacterized protein n=1 Tax=Arundo donax TaxID=35708 RepID=A0A0A9G4M6_ARUDO